MGGEPPGDSGLMANMATLSVYFCMGSDMQEEILPWLRISNEAGLTQTQKNMQWSEGKTEEEVRTFFFHKEEKRKSNRCKPECFLFEDVEIGASITLSGIIVIHNLS